MDAGIWIIEAILGLNSIRNMWNYYLLLQRLPFVNDSFILPVGGKGFLHSFGHSVFEAGPRSQSPYSTSEFSQDDDNEKK
jgi:hypothetical protein